MPKLLHVSDLCFRHPGVSEHGGSAPHSPEGAAPGGIAGLSFALDAGERVALLGPNGSGKSTLLLLLAGCLTPQRGSIRLNGEDCAGQPRKAARHVGLLFQNQDCQLLMPTVREELLLSLGAEGSGPREEALAAVEDFAARFGLTRLLDSPPHRLSTGERQRVALGTLCINRPGLLLLDEPTAALDPQARRLLAQLLEELDTALLMATHDMDFALHASTRVLLLHEGRLAHDGPSRQTLRDAPLLRAHALDLPLCLQPLPDFLR